MNVKCECSYEWDFVAKKIKNPLYCTCPRCNKKIRLRESQA